MNGDHSESQTEPPDHTAELDANSTSDEYNVAVRQCSRLPKKRKSEPFERELLQVLKGNMQQESETQSPQMKDPDEMFLLSQLPAIKMMRPSDKIEFQIKFMQLIKEYTAPTFTFTSPTNVPVSNPPSVSSYLSSDPSTSTPHSARDHTMSELSLIHI